MNAPLFAFRADVEKSGECWIPEVFADPYQRLSASLDWARVFAGKVGDPMTAIELEAAATAADELAAQCRRFAAAARGESKR
jgi:hypothetical protein